MYLPYGCYTVFNGNLKYYPNKEVLSRYVDVNIQDKKYGDSYWGSRKPNSDEEYGIIKDNKLYFVDKYNRLTGNYLDCDEVNRYLNMNIFRSEISSGNIVYMSEYSRVPEPVPNKAQIEQGFRDMFISLNNHIRNSIHNQIDTSVDFRLNGEFESQGKYFEKEDAGQFTPVIRFWVNNGVYTSLLKYNFFINDMRLYAYRKRNKLGELEVLLSKYKLTNLDSKLALHNLEYYLRQDGLIGKRDRLCLDGNIVCNYIVEFSIPLCNQRLLNDIGLNITRRLIEQINRPALNYKKGESNIQARSYDVFENCDFGMIATVKTGDSYKDRITSVRFIFDRYDTEEKAQELKNDLDSGNIELYIAHYTDVVKRNSFFRQHLDRVLDEDCNKVVGFKQKAKEFDVDWNFNKKSVGIKEICNRTHNMEPIVHALAAPLEEWNYLNDNVFTLNDCQFEFRDFSPKGENRGKSASISLEFTVDEFSATRGEILEVYLHNKRTNEYKALVLCSPASSNKSSKKSVVTCGEGLRGKTFSKPVKKD